MLNEQFIARASPATHYRVFGGLGALCQLCQLTRVAFDFSLIWPWSFLCRCVFFFFFFFFTAEVCSSSPLLSLFHSNELQAKLTLAELSFALSLSIGV